MASCGTACLKIILVVFNILFWLFGLGLLGIGVWLKVDREIANVGEALKIGVNESVIDIAAWVFIGAGIWAFLVGFFGCCGAIRESQCLLGFYLVCLFFVFAAEAAIAVYAGIRYNEIIRDIENSGSKWVRDEYNGSSLVSQGFNYVQIEFCCCGVKDYRDYNGSAYLRNNQEIIKDGAYMSFACCKPTDGNSEEDGVSNLNADDKNKCIDEAVKMGSRNSPPLDHTCDSTFRSKGCVKSMKDWVNERLPICFGVAAGVAGTQILVFILAVCLCVRVRREEKDHM